MYTAAVNKLEASFSFVFKMSIPRHPAVIGFATCAGIYGRRIAQTYAPGYISDFFISRTIVFMKSETLGRVTGITIVAPMLTPDLIPYAEWFACSAMTLTAILIGNLVYYIFKRFKPGTAP